MSEFASLFWRLGRLPESRNWFGEEDGMMSGTAGLILHEPTSVCSRPEKPSPSFSMMIPYPGTLLSAGF